MINSYDRRIIEVLNKIDFCSTPGEVDPIQNVYYTESIWNIIQTKTKAIRDLPEVHKIKALAPVGSNSAIQHEDDIMFKQIIVFNTVQERRPAMELNATSEEIVYLYTKHLASKSNGTEKTKNSFESACQRSANKIFWTYNAITILQSSESIRRCVNSL